MVTTLARAQGVPLVQIAELIGVHRNALTAKLKGARKFKEDEIVAIAEFFGVSPGHLFEDPCELLGVGAVRKRVGDLLTSTFHHLRRSGPLEFRGEPGFALTQAA